MKQRTSKRATAELCFALLRDRLRAKTLLRARLTARQAVAVLALANGESLAGEAKRSAESGLRKLIAVEGAIARDVIDCYRGDRVTRDEPEFPASGCYVAGPALRRDALVNADDLVQYLREPLATVSA